MSTTQFDTRRRPRQYPFPILPDPPVRLQNSNTAPATPTSTSLSTGFFTPSAAAAPQATPTASTAAEAIAVPTPTPVAAQVVDLPATVQPVGAGEAAPPLVTDAAAASGTGTAVVEEQNPAVTMSPGGVAMGSIAGIAFLFSALFLLYKWRRGTLPQALHSAARTLKLRPPKPAPEADTMEKGLTADAASIRSESASIHTVSSLRSNFSMRSAFSSLKRSVSVASSRGGDGGISRPAAFEGEQGDKLAVPLELHLARLEAAGLWTADAGSQRGSVRSVGAGKVDVGKMDPSPVVEEPNVHPLRAHLVHPEKEG